MNEQVLVTVFLIALVIVHLGISLPSLRLLKREVKAQSARIEAMSRPVPAVEYSFAVGDLATQQMVRDSIARSERFGGAA